MHAQVQRLTHLASTRASEMMQDLKAVLQQHEASRVSIRVRRHASAPQQLGATSRSVTTLLAGDVTGTEPCTTCAYSEQNSFLQQAYLALSIYVRHLSRLHKCIRSYSAAIPAARAGVSIRGGHQQRGGRHR